MLKRIFISVVFLFSVLSYNSQTEIEKKSKHYPSVLIGAGYMKFSGDVGKENETSPLLDARMGYYLKAEYRLGNHLGLMLGGIYGNLAGTNNTKNSRLNFESKTIQADLNLVTYFDFLFQNDPELSPYFSAGVGYLSFDSYADLKNGNTPYYYWSDGSIRDLPEIPANVSTAQLITRDYTYETRLKDSSVNYSRNTISIPIGGGFDWQLGKLHRWDVQVGFNYNFLLSDYVDNYKTGGNDSYWLIHAGLKYTFAPKPKNQFSSVDFKELEKLDSDEDGVVDNLDDCPGTPKNISVDRKGCPPDTDEDGVADYKDLEPGTKKGIQVNQFGETIDLEKLAQREMIRDSLELQWGDFAKEQNVEYVKSEKESSGGTGKKHENIPQQLRVADTNKDGEITVKEISNAIDAFFDGSNTFTIEIINKLIDYFFEQ